MEKPVFTSKVKVKCSICDQEIRKDMIDRHFKTKHPSQVNRKIKFNLIPVKGQSSLLTHGFTPSTSKDDNDDRKGDGDPGDDQQNAVQQIDMEEDIIESFGDKRMIEDDDDYNNNENKRVERY